MVEFRPWRANFYVIFALTLTINPAAGFTDGPGFYTSLTRTRSAIPRYCYSPANSMGVAAPRAAVLTSLLGVEEQVVLIASSPKLSAVTGSRQPPWKNATPPAIGSILSRPGFSPTIEEGESSVVSVLPRQTRSYEISSADPILVRRKRFVPSITALTLDHIQLDQVGLALYETGEIACTGILTHSGGINGELLGNRVTIRVRAFGGVPNEDVVLPNGPILWESSQTFWLRRGEPVSTALSGSHYHESVRRHFDEISKLQVIVEYRRNR